MNKKLVFCGGGNMAEGIIRGLIKNGELAGNITVSELKQERCDYLSETYGVTAATDVTEALKVADMVIVAVLPAYVGAVAETIKGLINQNPLIMSIAAAVTIDTLESHLGSAAKIARVMPNTLSQSGNGFSAVCLNKNVSQDQKTMVTNVVEALGKAMYIDESMFDAFTAFSCSGPMWLYKMADALINAGVYESFNRSDARDIVLENMLGAAKILQMSGDDPSSRVNEMCSPGGVTIEGFRALADEGFDSAIMASVDKAVSKAKSL